MNVEHTVEIAARPERVWTYIEDPAETTRWMDELVENEQTTDGSVGTGSTFRMKIKEGSRIGEYRAEVVEHESPRSLKLEMTGASFGDTPMTVGYTLHDLGDGRTRVEYVSTLPLDGFLWTLLRPVLEFMGRRRVKRHFENLKELSEGP